MPVDPHIAGLLELVNSTPPMHQGTPEEARAAFAQLAVVARRAGSEVPVASAEDITLDAGLAARVYRPEEAGPVPTVLLFHGGGWVIGDLDTHDAMARSICRDCRAVVVSVGYRLAPEAPFPAAVEDALTAARWAAANLASLGGSDRLAVAGDSAGGNLAAVVAQTMREQIAAQLLVYPAVDATGDYPSRTENAEGYFLDLATMAWFIGHYAADTSLHADPRISPLLGDLTGLPPAVVVTAEYDPLRDEGEEYAERLRVAGNEVVARRFDGMIHGFFDMGPFSPAAQKAVDETCTLFAELLHR